MDHEQHAEGGPAGRRTLLIANETLEGTVLHEAVRLRGRHVGGEVVMVAEHGLPPSPGVS
jgi:hypothetical protein